MDEIKQIKEYLKQNQKIIRFASDSISLGGSFDETVINDYIEDENTVMEFKTDVDGIRLSFTNFKNSSDQAILEINKNGIDLCVKKKDAVSELNSELQVSTSGINCTSKKFLVNTDNLKITENSLTFNGTVYGTDCNIGGFSISGNNMTGDDANTIVSGTINANYMNLRHAVADLIECNPNNDANKVVNFTSCYRYSDVYNDETSTSVTGLNVVGNIRATYGWNGQTDETGYTHGTEYNLQFDYVTAEACILRSSSGSYSTKNRLRCTTIYSSSKDDTWSDARLKRDVKDLDAAAAEHLILGLRTRKYRLKKSGNKAVGYIAQEIAALTKENGFDGIVARGNGYYALSYSSLIAFRIKMIQNNQMKIEKLRRMKDGNRQ